MSQDLARYLVAAGSTTDVDSTPEVQYILSVDPKASSLQCQHWTNDSLGKQEHIVDSVRPNSTAAYLITPTDHIIVCITPSSHLSAYTYDKDEDEWVESDESPIAKYAVHPSGKLVASTDATGKAYVFFQDPSQHLVCLDDAWASTILPVKAVAGTPITTLVTDSEFQVFYIAANDNFIHGVARGSDGTWRDAVAIKYAFTEEISGFCMGNEESYVLTGKNELIKVTAEEGKKMKLGTVQDGKFVPATTEEARITTTYYPNGRMKSRVIEGARVSSSSSYYRRY